MRLYIDVDSQRLVQVAGAQAALTSVAFKRGDSARIEVQFVSGTDVQELAGTTITGSFALKETGKYDQATAVVGPASWTKEGTGTSTKYVFTPNFGTSELNDLLNSGDADDSNDVASVTLMGEISWTIDGAIYSTQTFVATVANDVIKGGDGPATPVGDEQVAWLAANGIVYDPAITGLTGGGATKLDGIATEDVDVGRIQAVSVSSIVLLYRLEDGDTAEDGVAVIRPDDYATTTNEKVWVLISLAVGSISLCGGTGNVSVLSPGTVSGTSNLPDGGGVLKPMPTMDLASPSTGFTITASNLFSADVTCYLTPAGTLATGTFNLPAVAGVYVGQVVRVHSTQEVTSVTVAVAGGGTISGAAVTTFAAGVTYAWQCVSTAGSGTWIRLQ